MGVGFSCICFWEGERGWWLELIMWILRGKCYCQAESTNFIETPTIHHMPTARCRKQSQPGQYFLWSQRKNRWRHWYDLGRKENIMLWKGKTNGCSVTVLSPGNDKGLLKEEKGTCTFFQGNNASQLETCTTTNPTIVIGALSHGKMGGVVMLETTYLREHLLKDPCIGHRGR